VTRNVPRKLQRSDLLRKKRAQAAQALPTAAKVPPRPIPQYHRLRQGRQRIATR
jgi:hypothetical protein